MPPKPKDMTGLKFSRLTVVRMAAKTPGRTKWECVCDCGGRLVLGRAVLVSGNTRSCGCLFSDVQRARSTIHGHTAGERQSREYETWRSMIKRCTLPRCPRYERYGGRGISVCARWTGSFSAFLADMGPRPPGRSIDRINNDGNYEPGNCQWVTRAEQARNTRANKLTEGAVGRIRAEIALGARNFELAPKYGVHSSVISRIRHNHSWRQCPF